jgi:uncharacterized delta-60 repeat protein
LNEDGSLDNSFAAVFGRPCGGGQIACDGGVRNVEIQPDGKLLVAGAFTSLHGNGLARLNADGSYDTDFRPVVLDYNDPSRSLALQPDGKIIVSASAFYSNGWPQSVGGLVRLRTDGSLDTAFSLGVGLSLAPEQCCHSPWVHALLIESGGQVLVGGYFGRVHGAERFGLARLNGDGRFIRLSAPERTLNGSTRMTIASQAGFRYVLQRSDNLIDWVPVTTTTATGYELELEDPDGASAAQRFYRALLIP